MPGFDVSVVELKKVYGLPDSWSDADYRALLGALEVDEIDDLAGADLLEILLMALQDLEPEEAGDRVLAHKLKNRISRGSRQNIVEDLLADGKPWEEWADLYLHASIFEACVLLHQAWPKVFPRPACLRLRLRLEALQKDGRELLSRPPEPAFVARVLADGMDEKSILERLFDEQLVGREFAEAEGIVWRAGFDKVTTDGSVAVLAVYSSQHWLEDIEDVDEFRSTAYNDRPRTDDDDD